MKRPQLLAWNLLLMLTFAISTAGHPGTAMEAQLGEASYYADSLDGNKTASGARYNKNALTAAHRTLALGSLVKVTYLKTGKSVEVVINDRGPYAKNRIIDLSRAAAQRLGLIDDGHGTVKVEVINP
ncbi:MAG: septal ring lytic transglycosylase RlpA family protein [Gammaproteobacteria bacterium]|nr:MAG: septal ring lytic transglycosylase RlpA family protein [Gammaproteobacteria bacterium]